MSGVATANSKRACKHILRYALVAAILLGSSLPCNLLAYCISRLAFLQTSVNHGARVFPHLLGFFGEDILISFTTPAFTASYSINLSTAAARSSLLRSVSCTRSLNFFMKSYDPVCSVHYYADVA
jgi:hypothetical protein